MANPEGLFEETVVVTAIHGDWMTVEKLEGSASCAGCTQACPSAFLKRLRGDSGTRWKIPVHDAVTPGEIWVVGVDPAKLLRGATHVYVLPLTGLLVGAILGNSMAGDVGSVLGGLAGLALAVSHLWISRPAHHEISPIFIKKIHSI